MLLKKKKNKGFTLIEVMVVVVIIAVFILIALFAYQKQLFKGRDARRKADLNKLQNVLEDYLNDNICYPERDEITSEILGASFTSICSKPFAPYISKLPCDPKNNVNYNYFYSYEDTSCKSWYKIYTKLENEDDPIIEKVGCGPNADCPSGGCGPDCNYNYWVSSSNVTEVVQLSGEWWPVISIPSPSPGGTPSPIGGSPSPSPSPSPGTSPSPGVSPTPSPSPTPTPFYPAECVSEPDVCNIGCVAFTDSCATCCLGTTKKCILVGLSPLCCYTEDCPVP